MERYANGDEVAFAILYDRISPRLHAYLMRRTRDRARTEDLMQQTFLHMHRARGRFHPGAQVLPWMYAIAHRLLIDTVRKDGRERLADDDEEIDPVCPEAAADDALHVQRLARRVDEALAQIPETQRLAYELVRHEGLSMREAAEALGTTVSGVKLRAHRAYQALRGALGDSLGLEP